MAEPMKLCPCASAACPAPCRPVFAIFLIVLGVTMLARELAGNRNHET